MAPLEYNYLPEAICRLIVALILGLVLGVERAVANKSAGVRTFSLVSLGSALFVVISQVASLNLMGSAGYDPLRIASQVIVGIGFLGAGLIIHRGPGLIGLTTAAGMWVAAGIGMAVGFGFYLLAVFATFFTLFIFIVLWFVEDSIKKYSGKIESKNICKKDEKKQ